MTHARSQTKQRELTFDDYMATPETMRRHEVIDGVIEMSPAPLVKHQLLLGNLYRPLFDHTSRNDLGTIILAPADLLIRKTPKLRVRQPDLMFISRNRSSCEAIQDVPILEITPDLAVEIRSPSDRPKRWADKLSDYASIQVPELWRIDPVAKSVEVYALVEGRYSLERRFEKDDEVHSRVLPGLALQVRSLFVFR